ncbi:hypothetical protein ABD76_25195 [Paenibacillus dendritiformis]|nr:hypothetical protein [Paenibacillus dendritiformis]
MWAHCAEIPVKLQQFLSTRSVPTLSPRKRRNLLDAMDPLNAILPEDGITPQGTMTPQDGIDLQNPMMPLDAKMSPR